MFAVLTTKSHFGWCDVIVGYCCCCMLFFSISIWLSSCLLAGYAVRLRRIGGATRRAENSRSSQFNIYTQIWRQALILCRHEDLFRGLLARTHTHAIRSCETIGGAGTAGAIYSIDSIFFFSFSVASVATFPNKSVFVWQNMCAQIKSWITAFQQQRTFFFVWGWPHPLPT